MRAITDLFDEKFISTAEKRRQDAVKAEVEARMDDDDDLPCGPDCPFLHDHVLSPSELAIDLEMFDEFIDLGGEG